MQNASGGRRLLSPPIAKFMRDSHRFNMIVLVWEAVLPRLEGGGGYPQMAMQPIYHNFPLHPLPDRLVFTPTRDKDGNLRATNRLLNIVREQRER